jgi:hypothetical protein
MKRKWTSWSIDLDELAEGIQQFFENRLFVVRKEKKTGKIKIQAFPKQGIHKILEQIVIFIDGKPEDFEICFQAGAYSHSVTRLGYLTTLLGGGAVFLRGVKSEEELEKLEREFWDCMYTVVEFYQRKEKERI